MARNGELTALAITVWSSDVKILYILVSDAAGPDFRVRF
jgi:hypothetical protein